MQIYRIFTVLGLFIALFLLSGLEKSNAAEKLPEARVISVNDGDTVTIVMNDKRCRVRLVGVDAPEMGQEPWGKRAQERLRMLLKEVKWRVSVETDVEKYDKYDRLLAYLWTPDGEMLNERMVRDGYAVLFTIQPNSKYRDRFKKAQRIAREEKRGIWGADGLKETPLIYKKKHPRQHFRNGEKPTSENPSRIRINAGLRRGLRTFRDGAPQYQTPLRANFTSENLFFIALYSGVSADG